MLSCVSGRLRWVFGWLLSGVLQAQQLMLIVSSKPIGLGVDWTCLSKKRSAGWIWGVYFTPLDIQVKKVKLVDFGGLGRHRSECTRRPFSHTSDNGMHTCPGCSVSALADSSKGSQLTLQSDTETKLGYWIRHSSLVSNMSMHVKYQQHNPFFSPFSQAKHGGGYLQTWHPDFPWQVLAIHVVDALEKLSHLAIGWWQPPTTNNGHGLLIGLTLCTG